MRWTKKRREEFKNEIDFLVALSDNTLEPDTSDLKRHFGTHNLAFDRHVKLGIFQEAELLFSDNPTFDAIHNDYIDACIFERVDGRRDLPKRYSTSICRVRDGYADFYCLRTVPLSQLRGTKLLSPWFAKFSVYCIELETGVGTGSEQTVFWSNNRWKMPSNAEKEFGICNNFSSRQAFYGYADSNPETTNTVCNLLAGFTFSRDIHWRVVIKTPDGNSFSITTDSRGAAAAFKDRTGDTPSGRRPALCNWVSEHLRQIRKETHDGDEFIKLVTVRKHLRGRIPFTWCGLECELVVSPFDLRYNQRLAQQRSLIS